MADDVSSLTEGQALLISTAGTTRHLVMLADGLLSYRRLPGPGREDWQGSSWTLIDWISEIEVGDVFHLRLDEGPHTTHYLTRRSSTVASIETIDLDRVREVITEWQASHSWQPGDSAMDVSTDSGTWWIWVHASANRITLHLGDSNGLPERIDAWEGTEVGEQLRVLRNGSWADLGTIQTVRGIGG